LQQEPQTLAGLQTRALANGLRVIVVRRRGSPYHTAVIGFRGGLAHAAPPGVVTATQWGRRSNEVSPRLSGFDWSTRVSKDATVEQLRATGRDVGLTLKHLHRMLRGFSVFWPPREFDKRVEALEREDRFAANEFRNRMDHAMYGTQPLGVTVTAKQMRKIAPVDVNRWNDKVRRPDNGVLVVVGDLEPEQVFAAAAAELGGWGAGARPVAPPDDPRVTDRLPAADDGLLIQDRPGSKQVGLRIACLLPKASPDNYAAEWVFADSMKRALLGSFREEIGASYSVSGGVDVLPGGSAVLDIGADVDYGLLVPVLRQLRRVLAPAGPVPGGDKLESTRRGTAWRFGIEGATSGLLATRILKMWTLRWPIETIDKLPAQARAASLADVTGIAEHCRASSVVGLLGDESRLRASWSASGAD
jgi:zinc protease